MGSPKAWSLGSPVLVGQSVCITENAEDEEKTKEVKVRSAQAGNAKRAIEDESLEKGNREVQGLAGQGQCDPREGAGQTQGGGEEPS